MNVDEYSFPSRTVYSSLQPKCFVKLHILSRVPSSLPVCRFTNTRTVEEHPRGYPKLAALQSSDSVFAIYRRFSTLHTRCLLLAQDELCSLEQKLHQIDAAERTQLFLSSRVHDQNIARQSLLSEIRLKLREYGLYIHALKLHIICVA